MPPLKAQFATVHRIRFHEATAPEKLPLAGKPAGALSWKIGPSGPVGANGYRLPGPIWYATGLYRESAEAEAAVASRLVYMPFLTEVVESWHAVMVPFAHKGECNHLDRSQPGSLFEVGRPEPAGPCLVLTTAGFVMGPDFKVARAIEFRRQVDATEAELRQAEGCYRTGLFTPHTVGDDGVTISIWRDDASMLAAAYRPGPHRAQVDRHLVGPMMDRSSFTRFRVLHSLGQWDGADPLADLHG